MSWIDLLLQLSVPAWAIVVLAVIGAMATSFYKGRLDRRLKELEHSLARQTSIQSKELELIQERHRKRLTVVDKLNGALAEFDHAVDHLRSGDTGYARSLDEHYKEARTIARLNETLLEEELCRSVVNLTDTGKRILTARFSLSAEGLKTLEKRGLPPVALELLTTRTGLAVAVVNAQDLTAGMDDKALAEFGNRIFRVCDLSKEFDASAYSEAFWKFRQLRDRLLRSLPLLRDSAPI